MLFFACGFGACGLRKKTTEKTTLVEQLQLQQLSADEKIGELREMVIDSNQKTVTLLIKPKGKFSYSPIDGFVGEATELSLYGYNAGIKKSVMVSNWKASKKENLTKNSELSLNKVEKQTSLFNWQWVWFLLLLPIAIYGFRKKIINFLFPTQ
ncbi:MAG: hypothetical protein EOO42_02870 [Flavobacteriales bacterium]|nr:MAG: hypothetical protein EOO42_02870 [Flavobacteriales bacterium]